MLNNFMNHSFLASLTYHQVIVVFLVYFLSVIPVYFGIILMVYGSLKSAKIKNFFRFDLSNINFSNSIIRLGLFLFVSGWLLPYFYVIFFVRGLPIWLYVIVFFVAILSLFLFIRSKMLPSRYLVIENGYRIEKVKTINSKVLIKDMWKIYSKSFVLVNKMAPCQQSIKEESEFISELKKESVIKYLMFYRKELAGFGLVTNDLANCTWISGEYFKTHYSSFYNSKKLYYFMGIAIKKEYRRKGLSLKLLKYITEDLPEDGGLGFDHSYGVNKFIPYFSDYIKTDKKKFCRTYLDKQVYYFISRK